MGSIQAHAKGCSSLYLVMMPEFVLSTCEHALAGQAGGHAHMADVGAHLPAQSVGLPKPTETRSMSQSEMEPSRDWL